MAEKNLTQVFIGERRVTMDKRDGTVVLSNDHDGCYFDGVVFNGRRVGHAEGFGRDWTATAPDGTTFRAEGRKHAAKWLMHKAGELPAEEVSR